MQERLTTDLESSLLRSPKASEGQGGALGEAEALKRGNTVGVRDQIMDLVASQGKKVSRSEVNFSTPTTMDAKASNSLSVVNKFLEQGKQTCLTYEVITNLPTPTTRDYKDGTAEHKRDGVIQTDTVARAVFNSGEILLPTPNTMEHLPAREGKAREKQLRRGNLEVSRRASSGNLREDILEMLPTPQVDDSKNTGHNQDRRTTLASEVWETERTTAWGKFEPAIRRWEKVLGREAPAPTKPDGKEGNHRLSSEFTEWMMGVPKGWITDAGISRNEELKAAGNGVVPQQAELALSILLGFDIPKALERERERVNSDSNCLSCQYARRTNRKIPDQTGEILDRSDWEEFRCCSENGTRGVMFPTPTVSDTFTDNLASSQQKEGSMHSVTLPQAVKWLVD